jgi:hypothetical protein
MFDIFDFSQKVKKGAAGDSAVAIAICQTIIDERLIQFIPARSQGTPNPNDKGKRMPATRTSTCITCNQDIKEGDEIYFKRHIGASHVTCIDKKNDSPF